MSSRRERKRRAEAAGFEAIHAYLVSMMHGDPHAPGYPADLVSFELATNGDAQKLARHILGIMERAANHRWFGPGADLSDDGETYIPLYDTPGVDSY